MTTAPIRLLALLLALGSILGGCAGGGGAPTRFYVVGPVETGPLQPAAAPLSVQIVAVDLPQYLERFQIATQAGPDRLHFSERHQWGENLRKNLIRTLDRNLSRLLDSHQVGSPLARTASPADYRLRVSIEQFERDVTGVVRLEASWQLGAGPAGEPAATEFTQLRSAPVAAGDYDAIVAAMRELFGELSTRVAQRILALESGG